MERFFFFLSHTNFRYQTITLHVTIVLSSSTDPILQPAEWTSHTQTALTKTSQHEMKISSKGR
uniref:Uncharacterized protein n=1 Tax=Octopus bimaculoides TaxID=37653 RepID=A0A0L8H0H5_OCTBM